MANGQSIIIVKKKKVMHAAHHGGSWKVAYADFVTAMMAFFMVMWIMGMDQDTKDLVQGYFQNPVGFKKGYAGGQNMLSQGNSISSLQLSRTLLLRSRLREEDRLQAVRRAIDLELARDGFLEDLNAAVEVVVTEDGLRIEMMETGQGDTFFEKSSARLGPALEDVLRLIARQIAPLSNGVVVEGHTDSMPFGRLNYSNWELSIDRANAARRVLIAAGLPADHVVGVIGYADRRPKFVERPLDPENRRISLLLPFDTPKQFEPDVDAEDLVEALDLISRGGG